jgi:hypothetical protein
MSIENSLISKSLDSFFLIDNDKPTMDFFATFLGALPTHTEQDRK